MSTVKKKKVEIRKRGKRFVMDCDLCGAKKGRNRPAPMVVNRKTGRFYTHCCRRSGFITDGQIDQ